MNISVTPEQERIAKEQLESNPAWYVPISLSAPVSDKAVYQAESASRSSST